MADIHTFAQEHGFMLPSTIHHGRIVRFSRIGGRDRDSFYKVFDSGVAIIGDWHERGTDGRPIKHIFRPEGVSISQADIDKEVRAFLESQEMTQAVEAENCRRLYDSLPPVSESFGYLSAKGVRPCKGLKMDGQNVIAPFMDSDLSISTLETIFPDGQKRWHKGAKKQGCFFPIGFEEGSLFDKKCYLVEGLATGLSVHEATGTPVVVAGDCGNLVAVAKLFPRATVIADHDPLTGNAGLKSAKKTGLPYILIVDEKDPQKPCDANDFAKAHGVDALKGFIDGHQPKKEGLFVDTLAWLSEDFDTEELVEGWLPKGEALIGLFGNSGAGKTFLALDLALTLATGLPSWQGQQTLGNRLNVGYFCAEGFRNFKKRVIGWLKYHNMTPQDIADTFHATNVTMGMDEDENLERLKVAILDSGRLDFIIIDTLNRYMTGNENDTADSTKMINSFGVLSKLCSCPVCYLTHKGVSKDASDRQRGSSVWLAACDLSIDLRREKNSNRVIVEQRKNKDGECQTLYLESFSVPTGFLNRKGEPITTLVYELSKPSPDREKPADTPTKRREQAQMTKDRKVLLALMDKTFTKPTEDGDYFVPWDVLRGHYYKEPSEDSRQARANARRNATRPWELNNSKSLLYRVVSYGWVVPEANDTEELLGIHIKLSELDFTYWLSREKGLGHRDTHETL